jgi:4,4'-diaponeurosporenoate glycosyltransferase
VVADTAWFSWHPSPAAAAVFALGWVCGWVLLCRPRRLPDASSAGASQRATVAVVIPARDEAGSIAALVRAVVAQARTGDEVVVVDDHSTDDTAALAAAAGARVVPAPDLPPGWAGKPHACSVGAAATTADVLVFVDADVAPGPHLLDRIATQVGVHHDRIVSVQPWHRTERAHEQLSLLCNVTALMGSAAFTVAGPRVHTSVAFGPVLACSRDRYDRIGGHAHPDVRAAVLEDIALARLAGGSRLFVGGPENTTFRMYPRGVRQLVEGWTKGIGIGASATPWWARLAAAGWVTSLAGGWLTSPWMWLASAVQLGVLARVAGRFRWWAVLAHPVLTAAFVVLVVRSLGRRWRRRPVTWKGRELVPDQDSG